MRSTGAAITEIIEAYGNRWGQWVKITEIADKTGLTRDELKVAFEELLDSDDFWCEPEVHTYRVHRENAPVIGGEARHLIRFGE